jgi:hypothetical protein
VEVSQTNLAHRLEQPVSRRIGGPEQVDQRTGGHDLPQVERQARKHGPLRRAGELDRRAVDPALDWTQERNLHPSVHGAIVAAGRR